MPRGDVGPSLSTGRDPGNPSNGRRPARRKLALPHFQGASLTPGFMSGVNSGIVGHTEITRLPEKVPVIGWNRLQTPEMSLDPVPEFLEIGLSGDDSTDHEAPTLVGGDLEGGSVHEKEDRRQGESHPLVSIRESVVAGEALHQCSSLFGQGAVMPGSRPGQAAFEQTRIPDARCSAKPGDHFLVQMKCFLQGGYCVSIDPSRRLTERAASATRCSLRGPRS